MNKIKKMLKQNAGFIALEYILVFGLVILVSSILILVTNKEEKDITSSLIVKVNEFSAQVLD